MSVNKASYNDTVETLVLAYIDSAADNPPVTSSDTHNKVKSALLQYR